MFFGPNQTWGQPPAYAHQMMAAAAQPHALQVNVTGVDGSFDVVAAASADGSTVSVRVVNQGTTAVRSTITLLGEWHSAALHAKLTTLAAPGGDPAAANALATPQAVVPSSHVLDSPPFKSGAELVWPPVSVSTLVVSRAVP